MYMYCVYKGPTKLCRGILHVHACGVKKMQKLVQKPTNSCKVHLAVLEMQATLWEKRSVDTVSQILASSADTVAIMAVRQLPPVVIEQFIE